MNELAWLIFAIAYPALQPKEQFTMPIKPPVVVEVQVPTAQAERTQTFVQPAPAEEQKLIGPDTVTGELPTPYYLPQEVPQVEYPPRPDRPGYDLESNNNE